jgi:hypothetical protein
MTNWREDGEFIYGLAIVISIVVVYFQLYNWTGTTFALIMCVVTGVVGALVGFAVFETEFAVERWNKRANKQS